MDKCTGRRNITEILLNTVSRHASECYKRNGFRANEVADNVRLYSPTPAETVVDAFTENLVKYYKCYKEFIIESTEHSRETCLLKTACTLKSCKCCTMCCLTFSQINIRCGKTHTLKQLEKKRD